mgnify:CR=1 FL=1
MDMIVSGIVVILNIILLNYIFIYQTLGLILSLLFTTKSHKISQPVGISFDL